MLMYLIPCVLLLVVAIVLKKREDANKEKTNTSATKSNNKKSAKKNVARTARTSQRQQTQPVEEPIVVKPETKPLSPDLKNNIEKLIAEKNYFSAEAKINQALNQDNKQHDLYLYLLDVHLAQKDEFAVNQLINHIRSLGLTDIVAQAEEHQKAAQVESPIDTIAFEPSTPAVAELKDTTAFDALIGSTETKPEVVKPEKKAQDLTSNSIDFTAPEIIKSPKEEVHQDLVQPLEFTSPSTSEETLAKNELTFESAPSETQHDTVAPLEFSFTPSESTIPVPTEIAPEFKLDFSEPTATPSAEELNTSANQVEFKLTPSEAESQPSFSFDLDSNTHKSETVETAPVLNFETTSQVTSADLDDPLVKSFPELAEINEIQLNLDLAQQYISLGSYASARELLSQNEIAYTPEQREQSQKLLNQLAS